MDRNRLIQRTWIVASVFAAMVVGPLGAAAQPSTAAASFTATTIGLNPGAGHKLTIDILHWSPDAEIAKLVAAFTEKGEKEWSTALQAAPLAGYIWIEGESLGYSIRYAQRVTMPDGSERVLVATDRPVGSVGRQAWKATGPAAADYPFSIVELRINRAGLGEGKASLAGKVVTDGKVIALENYATSPTLLRGVKRTGGAATSQKRGTAAKP